MISWFMIYIGICIIIVIPHNWHSVTHFICYILWHISFKIHVPHSVLSGHHVDIFCQDRVSSHMHTVKSAMSTWLRAAILVVNLIQWQNNEYNLQNGDVLQNILTEYAINACTYSQSTKFHWHKMWIIQGWIYFSTSYTLKIPMHIILLSALQTIHMGHYRLIHCIRISENNSPYTCTGTDNLILQYCFFCFFCQKRILEDNLQKAETELKQLDDFVDAIRDVSSVQSNHP